MLPLRFTLLLAAASVASSSEFHFGTQTISVPDGFVVEQVAAPPLVDRPVEADFDEQGRLYVTDVSGTNDAVEKQSADKPHRVVRLEDTDGDGKFDKRTVFADGLGFPEGCLWHDGSLYVATPPQIWKFTDADGDGVAEKREVWFDGKTLTHCANDLHGPYLGPDGWIYWCKGAFAEQTYTLADGSEFKTTASHIFRRRPEGGPIEPVLTGGMDNPVGVTFDAAGERFLSCTFFQHPANGQRDGLIHAIYGGVYGKLTDHIDGHPRTSADLMPVLAHLGPAAACGLTRAQSDALGFRGNLFACSFNLRRVSRHELMPSGASFTTRDSDFLTSDATDFHPTDVLEDADGSLLVIDTGGWYKICCPTSQLQKPDVLGAIYRVKRKSTAKVEDPRGLTLDWGNPAKWLGDSRPAVRARAQALLGKADDAALTSLSGILYSEKNPVTRLAAVWALARNPSPAARDATRPALADKDPDVVHAALHSVSVWRDAGAAEAATNLLASGSLAIRRAAAEALGRIGNAKSVPRLLAADSSSDRILEHSLTYAVIELNNPKATRAARLTRRGLVALDQMRDGNLRVEELAPFLTSADAGERQTAWWIAGHHPDWSPSTLGALRTALDQKQMPTAEAEALLISLITSPAVQEFVTTLSQQAGPIREIAWHVIARAGIKEPPSAWFNGIAAALDAKQWSALEAALTLRDRKAPSDILANALARLAADPSASAEERLRALDAMATPSTEGFALAVKALSPNQPMLVRRTAISVLRRMRLADPQWRALLSTLSECDPSARADVITLFERCADEAVGRDLITALHEVRNISPDALRRAISKMPQRIQVAAAPLFTALGVDPVKQRARIEEIAGLLKKADIRRGQAVFRSAKTACTSCHAMGYVGGNVGPDLTRVGKIRTERDLIEAILFPSASFVRSFEPAMVHTRSGDMLGIIRSDTPAEVSLVVGPGAEMHFPRADVLGIEPASTSLMPAGYDGILSPQELADLVVFLKASM